MVTWWTEDKQGWHNVYFIIFIILLNAVYSFTSCPQTATLSTLYPKKE